METIDPETAAQWEQKLSKSGLPTEADMKNETTLTNPDTQEAVVKETEMDKLGFAMTDVLSDFAKLPRKLQDDILEDVRQQKEAGTEFKAVTDRVKILIQKGYELVNLTSADSDRFYKPKPGPEQMKLEKEINDIIVNNVDEFLKRLEEMRYKGEPEPGSGTQNNQPEQSGWSM